MTDKERREDDALKNLIQAAYDFSDEQLLADLEEVEATLSDSDFPGIEDRMYQKLKARMAEEENAAATLERISATASAEEEKKVVRFGKKKVFVVGILAAAFVGMLGVTAIGGKNYFFRNSSDNRGVVIDNDKNLKYIGDINSAYENIEKELGISVLKLGYIPENMILTELEITENKAIMLFSYNDNIIYFIQEQLHKESSIGIASDRESLNEVIHNKWINLDATLDTETMQDGKQGYSISVITENARYKVIGCMEIGEVKEIAKNLIFFN